MKLHDSGNDPEESHVLCLLCGSVWIHRPLLEYCLIVIANSHDGIALM